MSMSSDIPKDQMTAFRWYQNGTMTFKAQIQAMNDEGLANNLQWLMKRVEISDVTDASVQRALSFKEVISIESVCSWKDQDWRMHDHCIQFLFPTDSRVIATLKITKGRGHDFMGNYKAVFSSWVGSFNLDQHSSWLPTIFKSLCLVDRKSAEQFIDALTASRAWQQISPTIRNDLTIIANDNGFRTPLVSINTAQIQKSFGIVPEEKQAHSATAKVAIVGEDARATSQVKVTSEPQLQSASPLRK